MCDAAGQLAIEALPSALSAGRSHLYVYWKAAASNDIYGTIIRDPAVNQFSVTSTVDTFRDSGYGVSLVRGVPDRDRIDMIFTRSSGYVITARQHGRY